MAGRCIQLDKIISAIVFNSTITPQDAKAIIEGLMNEISELISIGHSVNIGFAIIKAVVKGGFLNPDESFDNSKHSVQIIITPTASFSKKASNACQPIRISSRKESPIVFKMMNHSSENSSIYKAGDLATLQGESISFDKSNVELGIFFTSGLTTIRANEISSIGSKKTQFKIPSGLESGKPFTVVVKSMFGSEIREGELDQEVWSA